MIDLKGKAAIVTGSSKGIGQALAVALAENGADVLVNYKNDAEGAEHTTRLIEKLGRKTRAVKIDVSSADTAHELIDVAMETFGRLDVLVNNAARTMFGSPDQISEEDWNYVMDTNARGPFFASLAARQAMHKSGGGSIINISSCAASLMIRDHALYTTSKTALEGMTKQLALEFAPVVRVNAVAPGPASVERNIQYDPNFAEIWNSRIPLGRVAEPGTDVAGPVLFLASELSQYVTGQVIHADGGWFICGATPDMSDMNYESDRMRK